MQIVFRHVTDEEFAQPPEGEVILRLRHETATGVRAMAEYVLKHGVKAFPQGTAPLGKIVAPFNPTLDDMLAVEFAQRLLAGEKLPEGAKSFARYAALAREGLKPGEVPLESSLEGIYLAMRNNAGEDLTKPEAGARFAADWARLAEHVTKATKAGVDPFMQAFLAEGPEFARERSFLRHDREVFRQDVQRGQEWNVKVPGGAPDSFGLLLHEPKSLLFKYWSRDPQSGRDGKPYLLLAVDWGNKQWVFSTDPVQRLSLLGLHEKLQAAEAAADAGRAASDPWFDGAVFAHTLVAAPKNGTVLSDKEVLRIARDWSQAKTAPKIIKVDPGRGIEYWSKWAGLVSATVGVTAFVLTLVKSDHTSITPVNKTTNKTVQVAAKGDDILLTNGEVLHGGAERGGIKITPGRQQRIDLLSNNPAPIDQNVKLRLSLAAKDPEETAHLKVQSFYVNDEGPLYANFEVRDGQLQPKPDNEQDSGDKQAFAKLFHKGQNKVTLAVTTDGDKPAEVQAKLDWQVDTSYLPDLYLLVVGVGDSLPHSVDDAQALYDFFGRKDTGLLFKEVHREPLLVNEQANKDAIFDAINELNSKVGNNDVVLICISAHGTVVRDRYYLLPSGWNESEQTVAKMNSSAISQDDFLSALKELAEKCYVLVVLDTCHAGAISVGGTTRDVEAPVDMKRYFDTKKLVDRMQGNPKGIVIISACLGSEQANELNKLQHGALTFALLEGLQGQAAVFRSAHRR